ncbi:MAG: 50S ribosomal protein L24 [Bacteroidia bacterium]|nr:50S ribosomal protein L24 [Bacteroidia bacterium]
MRKKLHIKKGDMVEVITGDYKGQQGKVLEIIVKKDQTIVEGVNIISKHTKPNQKNQQGGILKKESPIHISNVLPVDPKTGKASRIGRRISEKNNKLVRYAKNSGEELK